jgi:UTP:GlnB (protein PII) uridylyltransferase
METKTKKITKKVQDFNNILLNTGWNNVDFNNCSKNTSIYDLNLTSYQLKFTDQLYNMIPEWKNSIGRTQHPTHDFTIDIHTLCVISYITADTEFIKINRNERLMLIYSALMHDMEKLENTVDPQHPKKSADKASIILYRLGFDDIFVSSVYFLIKNHQILGLLMSEKIDVQSLDLYEFRNCEQLISLLEILAIADIKSVKKNEGFYNSSYRDKIKIVKEKLLKQLNDINNLS